MAKFKPTIYLAGPITGRNEDEANDWRKEVTHLLKMYSITGISPLRCEPIQGDRYLANTPDPRFGTVRAISSKNVFDVQQCDLTLAYMPKEFNPSYGTVIELAWAYDMGKPTILVTDDPKLKEHPVINVCARWLLDDLDAAIDVIKGIFTDYTDIDSLPQNVHYEKTKVGDLTHEQLETGNAEEK